MRPVPDERCRGRALASCALTAALVSALTACGSPIPDRGGTPSVTTGPVATASPPPPASTEEVVLPLSTDLPEGFTFSWRATWLEQPEGPLGRFEVGNDAGLTDLAVSLTHDEGGDADNAGEDLDQDGVDPWSPGELVAVDVDLDAAPPVHAMELRLAAPRTLEAGGGTAWTAVQALRASPTADEQESLLLERLDGLMVVARGA